MADIIPLKSALDFPQETHPNEIVVFKPYIRRDIIWNCVFNVNFLFVQSYAYFGKRLSCNDIYLFCHLLTNIFFRFGRKLKAIKTLSIEPYLRRPRLDVRIKNYFLEVLKKF